jgi:predicted site-specific integrase-resolvase
MNKKEVAKFLGVSTRIIEKYASEGRLGEVIYVRGKTGKQAEYNREAVENLKTILESPDTALTTAKSSDARLFAAQLLNSIATLEESRSASVRVSEKLLLNLSDCRLLTGLSEQNLRDAIKSEKLKAKIIGRGWKIKKQDLDDFVSNL